MPPDVLSIFPVEIPLKSPFVCAFNLLTLSIRFA